MPGFDTPPGEVSTPLDSATTRRHARYGLVLFLIYLIIYGGFVLLNAFAPELMGKVVLNGMNLATFYGFGLIVVALLLAVIYGWLCRISGGAR